MAQSPWGEIPVDDSNRELHQELVGLGLMVAVQTFTGGRVPSYRFSREGWDFVSTVENS